jgi:hypothetical protein
LLLLFVWKLYLPQFWLKIFTKNCMIYSINLRINPMFWYATYTTTQDTHTKQDTRNTQDTRNMQDAYNTHYAHTSTTHTSYNTAITKILPSFPLFLFSSFPLFLFSSFPLFLFSSFPLFLFSSFPLFLYSSFPLFLYSSIPLFFYSVLIINISGQYSD